MAAHVLTGLNQVTKGEFTLSQMRAALNLSSWTEDLTLSDWSAFNKLVEADDLEGIVNHAKSILDLYKSIWRALGEPRMREDWSEAYYSGDYKWFDLKLVDGQIVRWSARNLAGAIRGYTDGWGGPRIMGYKLHRNKRWNHIP